MTSTPPDAAVEPAPRPAQAQHSAPATSGTRLDDLWVRLVSTPLRRRLWDRGGPLLVLLLATVLRFWNLGHPNSLVFDETFYVKDAWTQWNLGYAAAWPENADEAFNAGDVDSYLTDPSFVVHPQFGKLLIGLGMALVGADDPVGWRIATVLAGVAGVLVIMLLARKLFRSTALTVIAGLLFAISGNAIVMSRVALLDGFVMLFALLGVFFVVLDREWAQRRLSRWVAERSKHGRGVDWGPALWWRPWMLLAAVSFGLTIAVKWNGLYFLAVFALLTVVLDALARRKAGIRHWAVGTLLKQAPVSFVLTVPVALGVYLLTWASWFTSDSSYGRSWADDGNQLDGVLGLLPSPLQSFVHYQQDVYNYHVGESRPHPYQANPLTWLLLVRPTSMFYLSVENGDNGCLADLCGQSITGLANPLIWWAGTAAALFLVYRFLMHREWRVGVVLAGLLAGYVPWLMYLHRTVFQFYGIAFEPYLILALTFTLGLLLGGPRQSRRRCTAGLITVGVFLVASLALSAYFFPLWTATQLDYPSIAQHWWLPSWR